MRPRHKDPIVCDEISQHGAAGANAHVADPVHNGEGNNDKSTAEEFPPDTTFAASTATSTASSSSCTGILRLEPQSPSCIAKRPTSCLIVKSLEDSIHSVGLSHHRPSGKPIHRSSHASTTTIGTGSTGNSSRIDDELSISFKTTFKTIEVREYPVCIGDNPRLVLGARLRIVHLYKRIRGFIFCVTSVL